MSWYSGQSRHRCCLIAWFVVVTSIVGRRGFHAVAFDVTIFLSPMFCARKAEGAIKLVSRFFFVGSGCHMAWQL